MKKNDLFSSLRDMMFIVQLEEFFDNFNNKMQETERKNRRALIKALVPFGIGSVVSLITLNPLFFCLGLMCVAGSAIVKIIQDAKEDERRLQESDERLLRALKRAAKDNNNDKAKQKVIYLDEALSVDETLGAPIVKYQDSDFYTKEFEEFSVSAEELTEEELIQNNRPKLEIIRPVKPLSKNETQTKIVHEYEMYCKAYNIPTMNITPKEWDILFDTIYERVEELGIAEDFYPFMNFLLKYVLTYSLVRHNREISIYSFIEKIPKLEIIGFDSREATSLAASVRSKIEPQTKIIDFKVLKYPNQNS